MFNLLHIIQEAEKNKIAVGHFNVSNLEQLKAITEAARELSRERGIVIPLIIGVSESERNFIGVWQAVALIKSFREEFGESLFLNADHTHSLEETRRTAAAGYDAISFDGSEFSLEENIKKTKEAVELAKSINPEILMEGEIGFIGSGSRILKEIPAGAAIKPEDLTKPEDAWRFVQETKTALFAPAVGNLHGMFADAPNPSLDILRIKEIRVAAGVPLVLHGGSGIAREDLSAAIDAGVSVIHISSEIRRAWRHGLETSLRQNPDEIAPCKIMNGAIEEIKKVVREKLIIFNKIGL